MTRKEIDAVESAIRCLETGRTAQGVCMLRVLIVESGSNPAPPLAFDTKGNAKTHPPGR